MEETKDNIDRKGTAKSNQGNLKLPLLDNADQKKVQPTGKIYRYDEHAFFSIDGEKYPAQRIQGRVLKNSLPIFY